MEWENKNIKMQHSLNTRLKILTLLTLSLLNIVVHNDKYLYNTRYPAMKKFNITITPEIKKK